MKATTKAQEALGKLNDGIAKQTGTNIKNNLNSHLTELTSSLNEFGAWVKLVPVAGSAVSSVVSLIDYFSGGGTKSSVSSGPSPIMIMNNFKATGQISSAAAKNDAIILLPGSDQTGIDINLRPTYNNIMGVFNLLYTPKVALKEYLTTDDQTTQCCGSYNDAGFCISFNTWGGTYTKKQHLYLSLIDPASDLKYVINPAMNIDMARSDIRAAYIIENCTYGNSNSFTNLQLDLESGPPNTRPIYRSSYYPIGALKDANPHIYTEQRTVYNNTSCVQMYNGVTTGLICTTPKVYLKIVARLRKVGATKPSEDIIFIAKYPVSVAKESITETLGGGLEDLAEDLVLPNGYNIGLLDNVPVKALNTISVGTLDYPYIPPSDKPIPWTTIKPIIAGEAITLRPGAVIKPSVQILVSPSLIYSSALSQQSLHATSGDLSSFCGGSLYNTAVRNNPTARTSADAEEIEVITKEDFFTFYPNPATNQVTFKYFIEEPSQVNLNILDLSGSVIGKLVDDFKEMGDYTYTFDSSDLLVGIYIVRVESLKLNRTEKLVIIR